MRLGAVGKSLIPENISLPCLTSPITDYSLLGGGADSISEGRSPRRTFPSKDNDVLLLPPQDPTDFLWLHTEEPHRSRRSEIMKKYPEVTKLMGYEHLTKYVVLAVVALQFMVAILLAKHHVKWTSWMFLILAYAIGGTANHNLFLAIHEITHNLAVPRVWQNRTLAIFANLPIGIPYSKWVSIIADKFANVRQRYHIEHHKFLGQDGIDTDLPTNLELYFLNNVLGKVFFAIFQILFYALRPTFVRSQTLTSWHIFNILAVVLSNYILYTFFGSTPLIYFIASSFFAGSLHPCAGHFIAEHYLWDSQGQETYSYYDWWNIVAYNVDYHNEHHDFPSIPWTRLPELRKLAPEYYDALPAHPSWPTVIVNFIRDPEVGIFARAKRVPVGSSTVSPPPLAATKGKKLRNEDDVSDKSE